MRGAAALLLVAACGAAPDDAVVLAFGADGVTPPLVVEGVVAIDVSAPGACFQQVSPEAPRTSVAAGAGRFVFAARASLGVRFGRVDCETLLPRAERGRLEATVQRFATSDVSVVPLRLHFAPADGLRHQLDALLAPAGLSVSIEIAPSRPLESASFHAGDVAELVPLVDPMPGAIDVVLAGCLRYADPIFGPPRVVDGYTPHIPGGFGPADAIFVRGSDCSRGAPIDLPSRALARTITHELGHALGLFHTVETDGSVDGLDDTDEHNLMHHDPARAASIGWSASQSAIMKRHLAAIVEGR